MKKLLIVAGFVGAFAIGSITAGPVFSFASSNIGNVVGQNGMMNSNQGTSMMGDSSGMGMMGSMNEMMDSMAIMEDLRTDLFDEAAKTLKVTTDELQSELQNGKSLETIAENEGVKADKLVKELQKVIQKDVKQLEKEGTEITEQQKEMLLAMSDNIEIMVKTTGMFACNGFDELNKTQGV